MKITRLVILALAAFSGLKLSGQNPQSSAASDKLPLSLRVDQWLSEGERKTFDWKVHVSPAMLTFQQRYRVQVTAAIDSKSLQRTSTQRELHFVLKVADQNGKWFEGQTYNRFEIKKEFEQAMDLQFEAGLYLQPGTFTVGVVVYDAVRDEHNVAFTRITVPPPKDDLFPQLLDGLPKVEFLAAPVDSVWIPGSGHAHLPLASNRPVQLDILVDLSAPTGLGEKEAEQERGVVQRQRRQSFPPWERTPGEPGRRSAPRLTAKAYQSQLLEAASILSDINPENGCSRVTVLNSASRRTVMSPQPATSVDWLKLWDSVLAAELNLVSVGDLAGSAGADFFRNQMEKLMREKPACTPANPNPLRVVAILSGAQFPKVSNDRIEPGCDCQVFYLRKEEDLPYNSDDVQQMLAPVHPKRLQFATPGQYRHKLAEFLKGIANASASK